MKKLISLLLSLSIICIPTHALVWEFLCGAASGVTGVDIYVPQEYFMPKEKEQKQQAATFTPAGYLDSHLFKAIKENNLEEIRLLIEKHNINVNSTWMAKNEGFMETPLMWAIEYGSTQAHHMLEIYPHINVTFMEEMVRILLLNGADVKATNSGGETALIVAAKSSAQVPLRVFRLLIEAGSDLNWEDDFPGLTALDYARKHNDVALVKLIEEIQQQTNDLHKQRYTVAQNPVIRSVHDRI